MALLLALQIFSLEDLAYFDDLDAYYSYYLTLILRPPLRLKGALIYWRNHGKSARVHRHRCFEE